MSGSAMQEPGREAPSTLRRNAEPELAQRESIMQLLPPEPSDRSDTYQNRAQRQGFALPH